MHLNLAPLNARRNIAKMGGMHCAVLGLGPAQLNTVFRVGGRDFDRATRFNNRRHSCPLQELQNDRQWEVVKRSALGLIFIYNLRLAKIASEKNV